MHSHALSFVLIAASFATACTSEAIDDATDDAINDDFLSGGKADGAIAEGSPEALGVLAVVNTLDEDALDDDVALDARAARGIAKHRAATDGVLDTSDDNGFDTLLELDKVPYVGAIAFGKLLAYAQANGYIVATSGWQWENPGPDGTVRYATWAVSTNDVWAVGAEGLVEHWNGSAWSVVPSGVDVPLTGVWASGPNDVWVIGTAGTILRWNGSAFSPVATTTTRTLYDVHGSGPNDVWIVGDNDANAFAGLILHWNGTTLTRKVAGDCPNRLWTVFAKSPTDVWVGGEVKTVCHFNGTTWSYQHIPDSGQMAVTDLWRNVDGSTWAVHAGEIWRQQAGTWTHTYSLPNLDDDWTVPSLARLYGISDSNLWAVGSHGFVVHWDGQAWTPTRIEGNADYSGIAVSSATDAWAVGAAARARLQGTQWQETYDVVTRQWLWGASGTSPTNLWALGSMGDIVRRTAAGWANVASPLTSNDHLYAVYAAGTSDVWFGGAYRSAHWNGQSITVVPELQYVRAMWGASANDIWAVGENGMIAHYNGASWTKLSPSPTYANLYGVAGTSATDVWAIGGGTLLHYDGTAWTTVAAGIGTYEDWSTIVAIAPDDVWIAGESPNLRHFDGTTWTAIAATTETRPWIRSGWAAGPDDVYFVLARHELLHWNGSSLEREPMPGAAEVIGFPGHGLWVTGEEGMIRRRAL